MRINCDYCMCNHRSVKSFTDEARSEEEIRKLAKSIGWEYLKVENGSYWDFCPSCAKDFKATK